MTTTKMTAESRAAAQAAAQREAVKAAILERLAALREARKQLDRDDLATVAAGKNAGLTYREMAPALGMTYQHMWHFFSPQLDVQVTVGAEPAADAPKARRRRRSG